METKEVECYYCGRNFYLKSDLIDYDEICCESCENSGIRFHECLDKREIKDPWKKGKSEYDIQELTEKKK